MKFLQVYLTVFIIGLLTAVSSCSTDDPTEIQNNPPEIGNQSFNVSEAATETEIFGTVTATDPDGDKLSFNLSSNLFKINSDGQLSLLAGKSLDFETTNNYKVLVEVTDGKLNATADISINVIDIDENVAPAITEQSFTVAENLDDATAIGTVAATDSDGDNLTFSISNDASGLFEITTEGELSLISGKSLDYETAQAHTISVEVADESLSSTANITITVTDINENESPVIEDQSFTVAEDLDASTSIGMVSATDTEGDELIFSITTDDDGLFEISSNGELSLIEGKSLDYETLQTHILTVQVTDGSLSNTATITIHVSDVKEFDPNAFVTSWSTSTTNESITIPINTAYTYNYTVDWGDGTITKNQTGDATHTYNTPGSYYVAITGDFPAIYFNAAGDKAKITNIVQWGTIQWKSMKDAFNGCTNLNASASDIPNLSNVNSMARMFKNVSLGNLGGPVEDWDVSHITDMTALFAGTKFNKDIGGWDVSNVTTMAEMFQNAGYFNQDISGWNMSSVTNISGMFSKTYSFNQSLNGWDVSNVTNMNFVFNTAVAFNQDISQWNVSNVTSMFAMFANSQRFNQNLSTWTVNKVTNCAFFAKDAKSWSRSKPNFTNCTF